MVYARMILILTKETLNQKLTCGLHTFLFKVKDAVASGKRFEKIRTLMEQHNSKGKYIE